MAWPGLDALITWRMAAVASDVRNTASLQKQRVIDEALAFWITGGRPAQTLNGKLLQYLRGLWTTDAPTQVRLAVAGTPGHFSPATAPIPTAAEMATLRVAVSPFGPWPVGQYVVAAGGEHFSWTGFDWVELP